MATPSDPAVPGAAGARPATAMAVDVVRSPRRRKTVEARVVDGSAPGTLTLRLTSGMGRGKVPEEGSVPAPGDRVVWTLFEHAPRGGPELPPAEATPWTHGGPPPALVAEIPDQPTGEDYL